MRGAQPGSGGSYLLGDNDERVSVLGQEVEDTPDLEGVVVADGQLALVQVLAAAQRPAHLVELLLVKVVGHLQQRGDGVGIRHQRKRNNRRRRTMMMMMMACLHETHGEEIQFFTIN